ncbi:hypothetical protein BGZ54_009820 [Gamsiella multidivaricata]|nr:hypothetical protein BGZ54_009820 [Gamsiella multidivaricata]
MAIPNIGGAQDVGQPSGSHHHFIHHAQDNITSNGSSSNSNRSGGPLAHSTPSSSPLLPQVSNIARQTQVDIQASHQGHDHVFNYAFDPMSHGYDDEEGIDDGEDRHSDEGSEDEAGYNEMEYYLQRCSICFDARLDFCLEYCRDQFCRDCFQRYVKEVVSNSWGLNVTKIKCPVCQDIISMSEWTKYVDKATLAQYNQYNQPYRSFSRFCNQCDHEMVVSQVNCALLTMPPRELMPLFDGILADLKLLLTLGGIELDDITPASSLSSPAKATSGHASTTKSKQRPIISERDQKARNIIQSFADAYRSYCGDSRGIQSSLPFKAQSYVSSLAYRALGGPVVQADPLELANQPNAASQQSQQPVSSSSMSTLHLPPTSSTPQPSQVLRPSQIPQTSQATQTHRPQAAPEQLDRAPGAFFLRRQHPLKAHGVLEMYKALMLSLLDLFDLKEKQSADEPRTSFCIDTKTMEAGDDRTSRVVINIGNATEDHRFRAGNDGQESNDGSHKPGTEQQDTVVHTSNIKRKGLARVDSPQAKRSRSTRPGVITRAESKRQVEIKKAIVHLSKQLSSMETRQEQWKELQFLHVRWLRWDRWYAVWL